MCSLRLWLAVFLLNSDVLGNSILLLLFWSFSTKLEVIDKFKYLRDDDDETMFQHTEKIMYL